MSSKDIKNNNTWSILFLVSLLIEVYLLSLGKNIAGVFISPILIIINNFFLVYTASKIKKLNLVSSFKPIYGKYILYALFTVLVVLIGIELQKVYIRIPIDSHISDVIPSIQKYNTRLLSGEFPYTPMHYDGYDVIPNYMPMQWFLFSIAEIFNFDYRWVAYGAFILMIIIYWTKRTKDISFGESLFKIIIPFLFMGMMMLHNRSMFTTNVELLLAAYYILLAFTIKTRSYIWIGIGILFCLLSRFSLLFWLPLYAYLLYVREDFKFIFKVGLTVLAGILLIYVLPFMTIDPYIFPKGLKYYSDAAVGEWIIKDWQSGKYPYHLGRGVGFAVYFYEFGKSSLEENLNFTKLLHVLISIATVFGTFLFYKIRKPTLEISFFILLSFKIYLSVFYAFIHIPYIYLQIVPLMFSIAILYELTLFGKPRTIQTQV